MSHGTGRESRGSSSPSSCRWEAADHTTRVEFPASAARCVEFPTLLNGFGRVSHRTGRESRGSQTVRLLVVGRRPIIRRVWNSLRRQRGVWNSLPCWNGFGRVYKSLCDKTRKSRRVGKYKITRNLFKRAKPVNGTGGQFNVYQPTPEFQGSQGGGHIGRS